LFFFLHGAAAIGFACFSSHLGLLLFSFARVERSGQVGSKRRAPLFGVQTKLEPLKIVKNILKLKKL
jgi:hypothetical protein